MIWNDRYGSNFINQEKNLSERLSEVSKVTLPKNKSRTPGPIPLQVRALVSIVHCFYVMQEQEDWRSLRVRIWGVLLWALTLLYPEKAMAPHSSTLACKIPWTEEPGRLQSMGSLGVGHDWATSLSLVTFTHWRRKWQPTPVFLPGESQGQWSLVGCRLWGRTESDTTEAT